MVSSANTFRMLHLIWKVICINNKQKRAKYRTLSNPTCDRPKFRNSIIIFNILASTSSCDIIVIHQCKLPVDEVALFDYSMLTSPVPVAHE